MTRQKKEYEIIRIGGHVQNPILTGLISTDGRRSQCDCCYKGIDKNIPRIKIPDPENLKLRGFIYCMQCAEIRTGYEETETRDEYIKEGVTTPSGDLIDEENPPDMFYETELDKEQYVDDYVELIFPDEEQTKVLRSSSTTFDMVYEALIDRILKILLRKHLDNKFHCALESSAKSMGVSRMEFSKKNKEHQIGSFATKELLKNLSSHYLLQLALQKASDDKDYGESVIHDIELLMPFWS